MTHPLLIEASDVEARWLLDLASADHHRPTEGTTLLLRLAGAIPKAFADEYEGVGG